MVIGHVEIAGSVGTATAKGAAAIFASGVHGWGGDSLTDGWRR